VSPLEPVPVPEVRERETETVARTAAPADPEVGEAISKRGRHVVKEKREETAVARRRTFTRRRSCCSCLS
jgi:hypothetical protein